MSTPPRTWGSLFSWLGATSTSPCVNRTSPPRSPLSNNPQCGGGGGCDSSLKTRRHNHHNNSYSSSDSSDDALYTLPHVHTAESDTCRENWHMAAALVLQISYRTHALKTHLRHVRVQRDALSTALVRIIWRRFDDPVSRACAACLIQRWHREKRRVVCTVTAEAHFVFAQLVPGLAQQMNASGSRLGEASLNL